jgi:hypothetical protein
MNQSVVGSIYERFSIKSAQFVNKHGCIRQFLFLLGWFLKLFSETESKKAKFYRKHQWKVLKISSFHLDWTKTWSPRAILVSDWLKFKNLLCWNYETLWFIWSCGFRRFLEINQSETRIAYGSHVCWRIMTKWVIFLEDFP